MLGLDRFLLCKKVSGTELAALECCIDGECHILLLLANRSLRICAHALLEEVVLVLERDALHKGEGIRRPVDLRVAKLE